MAGEIVVIDDFESSMIPNRQIEIYLPPNYDTSASYPVIYMHDGQNVFNASTSSYGNSWEVDEKMDSLISVNEINPAIVVAIWNHQLRWNEYLPEPCFNDDVDSSMVFPEMRQSIKDTTTYSDKYLGFIVNELKPFIDRNYATNPAESHTFLMGSSMGGLISFYGTVLYSDVFGGAACLSTHWTALDAACLSSFKEVIPNPELGKKYYFDHGNRGLDTAYNNWQPLMDRAMKRTGYHKGEPMGYRVFSRSRSQREELEPACAGIRCNFLLGKPD